MSHFAQCVKMHIKLSFLWCLQFTSNYLCVLVVVSGVKQRVHIHICIMKGKQMSKHRKTLSGIEQNDGIWCMSAFTDMYSQISMYDCAHWYKLAHVYVGIHPHMFNACLHISAYVLKC